MRVELTVPAGPEGSTPLLCVPACAGVLRIGNEEFAPSWTERRLPVDVLLLIHRMKAHARVVVDFALHILRSSSHGFDFWGS